MRPLKLHTKTTLLASAITVAVLTAALGLASAIVADMVRKEQRARAELQAISLADQISHMPTPRDPQKLASAANITRGARPGVVTVRIWERVGGTYEETAAAADSAPKELIPDDTIAALRSGLASNVTKPLPKGASSPLFRVFAPIAEHGRLSGAVELVERLDDGPSIAKRFESTAIWLALAAVTLITLATYVLFRYLVYQPIERLLTAISRAEAGDLFAAAPPRAPDELGLLSRGFNRMLERIRGMTEEREAQRRILQERVHEATAELEQRNEQLAVTNRELWQTTRRLTELERLAAAGQTAAQFAHEVGTPLNLISGHVQLLRSRLNGDERARLRLDTISAQIERIERIVRRMLDRTSPLAPELVPLDLNALLLRIFDATAPALDERAVRLETDLAPDLPTIPGDPDRLQQVFINLINNALDAMPGGGSLRVVTRVSSATTMREPAPGGGGARTDPPDVKIEFVDTGCGMAEDLRARIFDPFFTTKETGRGTGLGLVVVRQVLRELGGDVEVESDEGCGSRFIITIPSSRGGTGSPGVGEAMTAVQAVSSSAFV